MIIVKNMATFKQKKTYCTRKEGLSNCSNTLTFFTVKTQLLFTCFFMYLFLPTFTRYIFFICTTWATGAINWYQWTPWKKYGVYLHSEKGCLVYHFNRLATNWSGSQWNVCDHCDYASVTITRIANFFDMFEWTLQWWLRSLWSLQSLYWPYIHWNFPLW